MIRKKAKKEGKSADELKTPLKERTILRLQKWWKMISKEPKAL